MAPLPKKNSGSDRGLPVAEHCKRFLEKVLRSGYGATEQENMRVAGENFIETMNKLAEVGNKEDIRIPLRVIRDEIGRVYNGGDPKRKATEIDILFGLYDVVERACQDAVKTGRGQDAAKADAILEGLRERFSRLVIGETWDQYPELKLMALKRIYRYSVREGSAFRSRTKFGAGSGGSNLPTISSKKSGGMKGMLGLGVSKSMSLATTMTRDVTGGPTADSWQGVLSTDLGKCPASKLVPTMKLLLMENAGDLSIRDSNASALASGVGDADVGHFDEPHSGRTSLASNSASKPPLPANAPKAAENLTTPLPRSPPKGAKTDLTPAASDASVVEMPQAVTSAGPTTGPGRGISEVDLDDLLGLDDSPPVASPTMPLSPVTTPSAPSPKPPQASSDPFQGFLDSPKAAQAAPSQSMGVFGSTHPAPALPPPAHPTHPAGSFGADPFGGVGPNPLSPSAVPGRGGAHGPNPLSPTAATSPFAAAPAAGGGFGGGDPFGMSMFGDAAAGGSANGSGMGGFGDSAFGAPPQPGMAHQQHQAPPQPTAAAAAAAAEPSFNPFAPTTHSAPTQQGHTAAMSGWGAPTPTPPTAAPAASGDGAFDFTSFGDQAFGAAAPQSHLPGSKPPATAPAPAGNSSSPNPWGENAF